MNSDNNEVLSFGEDPFIDDRGQILNYYLKESINHVGLIDSKKNTMRGNHYHPEQTQVCLLIKGSYISVTKNILDKSSVIETRIVNENQTSLIPPNIAHTMIFLEDSIFINLVNGERSHENYGETHTLKYELVNDDLLKYYTSYFKSTCRVCSSNYLKLVHSFGTVPLANNLVDSEKDLAKKYPLELYFCNDCSNLQLNMSVDPDILFEEYLYTSSTSQLFVNHFNNLAKKLINDFDLNNESLVVDIGSNDGIFLKPLIENKINSVGVEPAKNLSEIANENGINTINSYFDKEAANEIIKKYGNADIVTAFNVFAHADGLKEITENAFMLLKEDGIFIIEVQSTEKMISSNLFDNIYHEHVNYWSLATLIKFFEKLNFVVFKFEETDTHGGSLRVYISKNKKIEESVNKSLKKEIKHELNEIKTYYNFSQNIEDEKREVLKGLEKLISKEKNIVFYGAPAKATTLLNYYQIENTVIKYTIEDNLLKVGKFIPNTGIEIINKNTALKLKPNVIIVLAWNFFEDIKNINQEHFPDTKFITLKDLQFMKDI